MNCFYIMLIATPTLCELLNDKLENKTNIFRKIGCILLIIMTTFRVHVGADLNTYYNFYCNVKNGQSGMDIGYYYLNLILNTLNMPFNVLLFVIAAFNVCTMYYIISKYRFRDNYIAIFLYLGLFDIYIYSLSAIRQSIAFSFFALTAIYLNEDKIKKAVICMLLGISFHWSLIFTIPLVVTKLKPKVKVYKLVIITIAIPYIYQYIMNSSFVLWISKFKRNIDYYLNMLKYEVDSSIFNAWIYIVICIIWIVFISYFKYCNKEGTIFINKKNFLYAEVKLDIAEWAVILFLISEACMEFKYNSAFPRLQMYLYFFLPLVVSDKIQKINNVILKYSLMLVLVVTIIWTFINKIQLNAMFYGNASFGLYS